MNSSPRLISARKSLEDGRCPFPERYYDGHGNEYSDEDECAFQNNLIDDMFKI